MQDSSSPALDPIPGAAAGGGPAPALPDAILRIPVTVQIVLGSTRLPISKVAEMKPGSIVTLDQKLGAPVAILVNGREVAKGDLFVLDGEKDRLGVTITDIAPASSGASRG